MDGLLKECDLNRIKINKCFFHKPLLKEYLKTIFKELTSKNRKEDKDTYLYNYSFSDYLKLPSFISENIFRVFAKTNRKKISSNEFVEGILNLLTGNLDKLIEFIFKILDMKNEGLVLIKNIKLFLFYLEPNCNKHKKYNNEDLISELDKLLSKNNIKELNLFKEEFCQLMSSDKLILKILELIFESIPITSSSVNVLTLDKKNNSQYITNKKESPQINIIMPSEEKTDSSPKINKIIKHDESNINDFTFDLHIEEEDEENIKSDDDNFSIIVLPSLKSSRKLMSLNSMKIINDTCSIFSSITGTNSENVIVKPNNLNLRDTIKFNRFMQNNSSKDLALKMSKNSLFKLSSTVVPEYKIECEHENYVYIEKGDKFKKIIIFFINKDIFYFNSRKNKFKGLRHISNGFAVLGEKEIKSNLTYYSFHYYFKNKKRTFYCKTFDESEMWVKTLQRVTNYRDIHEYYKLLKVIGSGKYGEVKLGVHKTSKEYFAVKIVDKMKLRPDELQTVRREVELLSKCNHKGIVKLIENFENEKNIYIVLEHLSGGSLASFLLVQKTIIDEGKSKILILQLAEAIQYLTTIGVVHRDLKPENIMFTDNLKLKIIDFGFSRVIGHNCKLKENLGTLAYLAPEVIDGKSYGKEVDIWSFGMIMYYIFSGVLPFDDAKKAINYIYNNDEDILSYNKIIIREFSQLAVDLIKKCLAKQSNRITIEQIMVHPWIIGK